MHTTTAIPTGEALEQQLRRIGFTPGVPPQITAPIRAIDAQLCRRLICPGCRKRRMVYRPFTDGRTYRVLACCQACDGAEEC